MSSKILYLKLKNYIGIYDGLGLKEIEIDMDKNKNIFIQLGGGNGSGKSTILSALHPFSGISDNDRKTFIRPNKKGLKEIHIKNNKTLYVIKHFYEPTKISHTVKSFITKYTSKNDYIELNENGNVTSFLEIIKNEFNLEQDYLKICRLGSNMTNFINMKSTERKNYISKFLSEAEIYTKLYKKVNDDCRVINGLLKNVVSKIDNLGEKEILENNFNYTDNKLSELRIERDKAIAFISSCLGELKSIDNTGDLEKLIIESKINYKEYENKIKKIDKQFENLNYKDEINLNILYSSIAISETNIKKFDNDIINLNNEISNLNNEKIEIENKIDDYEIELNKYIIDENKAFISNAYNDYKNDLKRLSKFKNFKSDISKKELMSIADRLIDIEDRIFNLNETNNFKLDSTDSDYLSNLQKEINKKIISLNYDVVQLNTDYENLNAEKNKLEGAIKFAEILNLKPKNCNNDNCPFIMEAIKNKSSIEKYNKLDKQIEILSNEINNKKQEIESACLFINYSNMIIQIKNSFDSIRDKEYLKINKFENCVINNSSLFDREYFKKEIEILESYEEYMFISSKVNELEKEMSTINSNKLLYDKIHSILEDFKKRLQVLDNKIFECKSKLKSSHESKYYNEEKFKFYSKIINLKENKNNFELEYTKYKDIYDNNKDTIDKINDIKNSMKIYEKNNNNIEKSIDSMIKERDKLKFKLNQLKKYTKEKKYLEENFKDYELVKKALSNKNGMPLILVRYYLDRTRLIANELLSYAFEGMIRLDEFEIDEKDFNIPCYGKGEYKKDISSASEGEKSIISLALSFALMQQSGCDFNIMQLDEMDGPLDKENRQLYLYLLEKQIEMLNIEQVFIISHNSAFEQGNVSYILLKNHGIENIKRKNIIYEF